MAEFLQIIINLFHKSPYPDQAKNSNFQNFLSLLLFISYPECD